MDRKLLAVAAIAAACIAAYCYLACDPANAWLALAVPLVGAVTANQVLKSQKSDRRSYLIAQSTRIYGRTLVYVNSSGYADDDTASGANKFAGVSVDEYDNSSGQNGDLACEVEDEGVFLLTGSGFAQTNVGDDAYGVDNFTISLTASGNVKLGRIVGFVSATQVWVKIDIPNS